MVSTRHHPRPFPGEPASPTGTSTSVSRRSPATPVSTTSSKPALDSPPPPSTRRATSRKRKSLPAPKTEEDEIEQITKEAIKEAEDVAATTSALTTMAPPEPPTTRSQASRARSPRSKPAAGAGASTSRRTKSHSKSTFTHTPPPLLVPWMLISLPLVIWDTSYILLRPHSMPGGRLHSPIWTPYALYGTMDYIYGFPAWDAKVGFTAAQGSLNAVETLMYAYYLFVVGRRVASGDGFVRGVAWKSLNVFARQAGAADTSKIVVQGGSDVAVSVLVLFATLVMTVSKTILYWLNEYYSGFANIGHNDLPLMSLWLFANGAWIVVPAILAWQLGRDIVEGMLGER